MDMKPNQQIHYNAILDKYDAHYADPTSSQYRHRFIHLPLFAGLNLSGHDVLEAMCGSGQTTEFLLSMGANVTGLDIADSAAEKVRGHNYANQRNDCRIS